MFIAIWTHGHSRFGRNLFGMFHFGSELMDGSVKLLASDGKLWPIQKKRLWQLVWFE